MRGTTIRRELIVAQARALKMPGVARTFDMLTREAREEQWTHEDYLHDVLAAEQASRHDSLIRQRLRDARFPEIKTLDTFDFTAAEGVSAAHVHALTRSAWITQAENLILAGPIGTGKTHLAIALGVEATKQKRRVWFTRAADLVRMLVEARDARELGRLLRRLLATELLIVDEVGFVPFDRAGGELLFNVFTDLYERRSIVVTTNLAFAEWVTVFAGDEKLTTALLDRLAHHATVMTTKGKSYRMRKRRAPEDPMPQTTSATLPKPRARKGTSYDGKQALWKLPEPWTHRTRPPLFGKVTGRLFHSSHRASSLARQKTDDDDAGSA